IGVGEAIFNEPLQLVQGLALLRFRDGAELIVEAPASFEPINTSQVRLLGGKFVGRCPTAASRGFTVRTPGAKLVALGTEFGIGIDETGQTLVHVFDGAVELTAIQGDASAAVEHITANEGRMV